jgi:hypothetical protein
MSSSGDAVRSMVHNGAMWIHLDIVSVKVPDQLLNRSQVLMDAVSDICDEPDIFGLYRPDTIRYRVNGVSGVSTSLSQPDTTRYIADTLDTQRFARYIAL